MIIIDIAVASFAMSAMFGSIQLFRNTKNDIKEFCLEQSQILAELKMLNYRVSIVEEDLKLLKAR